MWEQLFSIHSVVYLVYFFESKKDKVLSQSFIIWQIYFIDDLRVGLDGLTLLFESSNFAFEFVDTEIFGLGFEAHGAEGFFGFGQLFFHVINGGLDRG